MSAFTGLQKLLIVLALGGLIGGIYLYQQSRGASEVTIVPITATSPGGFVCGASTVNDADGNVYNTVQIGQQCWMKQNMRVGTRIDGSSSNQPDNGAVEKWCLDNNSSMCSNNHPNHPDGGLYQWNEAMQYSTTPGARGICPAGWHIPTHDEFTTLERAIATSSTKLTDFPYDTSTTDYRGTYEGIALKPNGTSGFEGNLAGRSFLGAFNFRDSEGYFWTSSESGSNAWYRKIGVSEARVYRGTFDKTTGLSVRCLKDASVTTISQTLNTNPDLNRGLVGHWTFDAPDVDWSSTTAEISDRSGNNRHGDAQAGTSRTSVVSGILGQGMSFASAAGFIRFPSSGNISAPINPLASDFTHAGWFKVTNRTRGVGDWERILSCGFVQQNDTNRDGMYVRYGQQDGVLNVGWENTEDVAGGFSKVVTEQKWYHFAVVRSGDVISGYLDGALFDSGTATGTIDCTDSDISGTRAFSIGDLGGVGDNPFQGHIDDVRVYNRALSADEVRRLYTLGGGVTVGDSVCRWDRVRDADGNEYDTVAIGTQCWMKQNMRVGTRINVASNQSNNATIEKWCYGDTNAGCTYVQSTTSPPHTQPDGGLYQWDEAMQYSTTPGTRGICPAGWHIPTHDEWTTLERAICTTGTCATDFPYDTTTTGFRGTNEGTKLKPGGTSGFEGNLAGYGSAGTFSFRGADSNFWSSLESSSFAWYRNLSSKVFRGTNFKTTGLSVRCVQDS